MIGKPNEAQFAFEFDILHRTFLGYPASLAPSVRVPRYFALYEDIVANHAKTDPKSRFTPGTYAPIFTRSSMSWYVPSSDRTRTADFT